MSLFSKQKDKTIKIAIIINAYYSAQHYLEQCSRIREELTEAGAEVDIIRNDGFYGKIENNQSVSDFSAYSACVYLDKDKYLSHILEKNGMRLFNRHDAIINCDDKMTTHIVLSDHDIAMPKTLPGLLCYSRDEQIKEKSILLVESHLGYPVVIKESYGSQGQSVYLARNRGELYAVMEQVKNVPHLFQEAISSSLGKDVRVIVIGGKAVGAMLRTGANGFLSNVGMGGRGVAYPLSASFKETAERAAKILNADYCGVDLLFGETGEPILCEVNSNAFFSEFERCTKINVAKLYAEYIINRVIKGK